MSTNLTLANVQIPAHVAARIGTPTALSTALASGLSSGENHPRISIKGGRFRIVEDGVETVLDSMALDVVIVGANPNITKTWYAKQWTPDADPVAPDCFSHDGKTPDPQASNPQNDLCASCPQNAWGSRVTPQGKEIKACSDQKTLAIVAADDPEGTIYQLQVTPAALQGLSKFHKELSVRGIPPEIVRTKVTFDTDASFPKLVFSFNGFLDEQTQAAVDKLFGSDEVKEITGEARALAATNMVVNKAPAAKPSVAPAPEPAPAPAAKASGFGKKAAAPVAEPAPEPAPAAKGFGKKAAAAPAATEAPVEKEVQAAPADVPSASSLADEIAALVGSVGADDA